MCCKLLFFFNDTATTEIYTLSLHDALPICYIRMDGHSTFNKAVKVLTESTRKAVDRAGLTLEDIDLFVYHQANGRILRSVRSEEHTSELQSRQYLVCRLLLEKKKLLENNTN